jgi:hypothetical protein
MHVYPIVGTLLLAVGITSCSRSNTTEAEELRTLREEVKSLRAELERQKVVAATVATQAVASAVSSASPAEFVEFLRISRRMVSAIGTGVSYRDFAERLVEVNASSEEALLKVNDLAQSRKIDDFVLALNDARTLWECKISLERDSRIGVATILLRKDGRLYHLVDTPRELGERWKSNFPDLVETYRLQDGNKDSPITPDNSDFTSRYGPTMFLSRALPRVFEFAVQSFRELEKIER